MSIKRFITGRPTASIMLGAAMLLLAGCAGTKTLYCYYLQRDPVVLIMPSTNSTEHPDASIIFNQACEKALVKKGFKVISADKVVGYASSEGLLLRDVNKLKASQIGKALKADMVLFSNISSWESSYAVLNTKITVAGSSRLMETTTDAMVWGYRWTLVQDSSSNNSNNGLVGLLVSAAVDAVANSMLDAAASLGTQAANTTIMSMPQPGTAPAASRPTSIAH